MADAVRRARANIQHLMAARGLRKKAFAEAMGKTPSWLSMILGEHRGIPLPALDEIATFFGVDVQALLDPDLGRQTGRLKPSRADSYAEARLLDQVAQLRDAAQAAQSVLADVLDAVPAHRKDSDARPTAAAGRGRRRADGG